MAMLIAKIMKPFTKNIKVSELYEKCLKDDLKGNKKVKEHLLIVFELVKELKRTDKQYILIFDIVNSFVRVTNFRPSIIH